MKSHLPNRIATATQPFVGARYIVPVLGKINCVLSVSFLISTVDYKLSTANSDFLP